MTASEFAFLALGLLLGVASGAALIEVLRARPPASRQVRLTVAPNAIQGRMAATLAEPRAGEDTAGPAPGGPGDRRWRDDVATAGEPATTGRRVDDRRSGSGPVDAMPSESGTPVLDDDRAPRGSDAPNAEIHRPSTTRPAPLWLRPTDGSGPSFGSGLVAVPMSLEPDPVTAALRSTAAASAVALMARANEPPDAARGIAATEERPDSSPPDADASPRQARSADRPRPRSISASAGAGAATTDPAPEAPLGTVADGPCADERRVADERCAVATRAREGATAAGDALRRAQRSYDELATRAEAAAAAADPRTVRAAKERAQQRFRDARTSATTRDDVEAGARAWLADINEINQETREATVGIERDRAAAAALAPAVERLAVEADAARIAAERADEACMAAREAVAACDEARVLETARSAAPAAPDAGPDAATPSETVPGVDVPAEEPSPSERPGRIAAATPEPEEEFAFSTPMHSQAGDDALILHILRGDRDAMNRAVARLASDDPDARGVWQARLGALAEALIARSIEATSFDFPLDHPFWGAFSQAQNRDIAAALSSLGFRFDGFGDWVDDRVPSQRDLSLATGYAGLDPMRIRRWPNEAEMRDLLRDVRVAADEYIAGAAGGLSLGELVTLLGRRADGLAELWNEWGLVRPILLEAS